LEKRRSFFVEEKREIYVDELTIDLLLKVVLLKAFSFFYETCTYSVSIAMK
jgi:hypothetical protein